MHIRAVSTLCDKTDAMHGLQPSSYILTHDSDIFPCSLGWRVKLQCNSIEKWPMGMDSNCYHGPNRDS